MIRFLQFTQWFQPFLRPGDNAPTQWPDRQCSIPVAHIGNIGGDPEGPGSLIWPTRDANIPYNRPWRVRENVQQLTSLLNTEPPAATDKSEQKFDKFD